MVETYIGNLEELGKEESKKDRQGSFRIDDSKIVFRFDKGNVVEIKFEEIDSIKPKPQKISSLKKLKEPQITLKDGRQFNLSITTASIRNGFLDYLNARESIDALREIRKGHKRITKLIKNSIK